MTGMAPGMACAMICRDRSAGQRGLADVRGEVYVERRREDALVIPREPGHLRGHVKVMQMEPGETSEELAALQHRFRRLARGHGEAVFGEGGANRDIICRDLEIRILGQQFE